MSSKRSARRAHGSGPSEDIDENRRETQDTRSVRAVAAEKQRERKLRDDPLVVVESPQLVICKRCGASIKLSLKSAYDPFHWHRHRERCLKRPDAVVRGLKDVNTTDKDGKPASPSPPPPARSELPKRRTTSHASTPPLTSDTEEDQSESTSAAGEELPSPSTPLARLSPTPPCDAPRSPLLSNCVGAQAFERWQSFSAQSYDSLAGDYPTSRYFGEHYDPMYWPRSITFQESQERLTI